MVISPMAVSNWLETLGSNAKIRSLREVGLERRSVAIETAPWSRGRAGYRALHSRHSFEGFNKTIALELMAGSEISL
jgi:hypothetical protein